MQPWIGVDLDGTLAHYDYWRGAGHIGRPLPTMVNLVKSWLDSGLEVRIVTARVGPHPDGDTTEAETAREAIREWCLEHLGQELEVTATKDFGMIALWDDRAVSVPHNWGTNHA